MESEHTGVTDEDTAAGVRPEDGATDEEVLDEVLRVNGTSYYADGEAEASVPDKLESRLASLVAEARAAAGEESGDLSKRLAGFADLLEAVKIPPPLLSDLTADERREAVGSWCTSVYAKSSAPCLLLAVYGDLGTAQVYQPDGDGGGKTVSLQMSMFRVDPSIRRAFSPDGTPVPPA